MEPQEQAGATAPPTVESGAVESGAVNIEAFVDQMAAMVGIAIPDDCRPGVIGNMTRTAAIARLVMEFPLPVDVEAGPEFRP